jgi:transposase
MKILGIDLGTSSTKSAATLLNSETGELQRTSFPTVIEEFIKIFELLTPDMVVVEPTPSTGLIVDLCQALSLKILVANTRDGAWLNRNSKTDKRDADLLARLAASGQLRTIHVPDRDVRDWKSLIAFRQNLIRARVRIKNHIKSLLRNEFIPNRKLWNPLGMTMIRLLSKPLIACDSEELWRGELWVDLNRYFEIQHHLQIVDNRLNALGSQSREVQLLLTIPGVGARLAEAVASTLDGASRFKNRKHVAAYVGLCPRVEQSGERLIHGRITKSGNTILRSLLVEVAWLGIRRDDWMRGIYEKVRRGDPGRTSRAVTAVARRLLIRCWAMLRDIDKPQDPSNKPLSKNPKKDSRQAA